MPRRHSFRTDRRPARGRLGYGRTYRIEADAKDTVEISTDDIELIAREVEAA